MSTKIVFPNMLTVSGISYPVFPRPPKPDWIEAAEKKGFTFVNRIADRLHLALRCATCGALNKVKRATLMGARPVCHTCLERERHSDATAAGLEYLHRDVGSRHYAFYRAPCGHRIRRQFELIRRMAAGETGIRCSICHAEAEAAEADARGWALLGADFQGDPNYRSYRHERCGQEQRIARANMQSGRFTCSRCGEGWPVGASFIYAMKFTLASSREVIKLGFSRDPESRLAWQLQRDAEMPCELLRKIAMPSGHAAIRTEKAMHGDLKRCYPGAIVAPSAWRGQIRVKSEIYDAGLTPVILAMLDRAEAEQQA